MNQSYSIFLFYNLAILIRPFLFPTKEIEYDTQFEKLEGYYNEFQKSMYNRSYEPEYECMVSFLHSLPERDLVEYEFSLNAGDIDLSFDYGSVMAENEIDARNKVIEKLDYFFLLANDAFSHSDNTSNKGFRIAYNKDQINIKKK